MRFSYLLPATLALVVVAGPALATPCADEISTLERRLNSAGAEKVTGKEPPGGATSSNSEKALDKPPAGKPSDPSTTATAGGVAEAKSLVQKARQEDQAGNADACRDTILKAKEKAGALP
ncbi:hypothetical protein [Methylobacterium sp. A54F]